MTLEETLRRIVPADRSIEEEAWRRWDSIAKPLRGLGLLEEAIARIASAAVPLLSSARTTAWWRRA